MVVDYESLDSDQLAAALRRDGFVDIQLNRRRKRLCLFMLGLIEKIDRAKEGEVSGLRKRDFFKAFLLNLWITIFHLKLVEITTFFTLQKPQYSLLEENDVIRFSGYLGSE